MTDNGHADVAYDLLLNREQPSWLYEVEHGATTIWENWFGIMPNGERRSSHNHYAFGAVVAWLMSRVLGITVNAGKITIRPYTDKRLGYAKGSFISDLGVISSEWKYLGDTVEFTVTVPFGHSAEFIMPSGDIKTLSQGTHTFRS